MLSCTPDLSRLHHRDRPDMAALLEHLDYERRMGTSIIGYHGHQL